MQTYEQSIAETYARPDLETIILTAYENAGKDLDRLTRADISTFDEFHIEGLEATRELARLAKLEHDTRVLDVGSGVGGPARTLAAEFDCTVTGIDLVEEYCSVAEMLTDRVGLSERATFHHQNALDLSFEDATFDVVWLQHVSMNIEDKPRLFEELHRVLESDGTLVVHEIYAGAGGKPHFPVPWADDPTLSFLVPSEDMSRLLVGAGFEALVWRDTTAKSSRWFKRKLEAMASRSPDGPTPLGLNLLIGPDTRAKMANVLRNLEEARIGVIQGVLTKPAGTD